MMYDFHVTNNITNLVNNQMYGRPFLVSLMNEEFSFNIILFMQVR